MESTIEIFFCYAREDEELRKRLEKQLRALKRQKLIDIWHDREISAGAEWEREIDKHLNTAQIILLLISPDFMDSYYCYGKEMQRAIERHERGEARVIPVILRPVYWQRSPFGKLQALPTDANAVMSRYWHNLDEAFFDVAEGIRKAVEELAAKVSVNSSAISVQVPNPASPLSPPQVVSSYKSEEPVDELPDWDEVPFVDDYVEPVPSPARSAMPVVEASAKNERSSVIQNVSNTPSLTVQQVKDRWELIKKRIKTKKDGGKVAPLLNDFTVLAVEGTAELPVVVIRAAHDWHYKTLAEKERLEFVEWAMKLEFGMECRVRLLPPSQSSSSMSLLSPSQQDTDLGIEI